MAKLVNKQFHIELSWRGFKQCSKCNSTRPKSCFTPKKGSFLNIESTCKICRAEKASQRRFKDLYKITSDDYKQMLLDQNYKCAICKTERRSNRTAGALAVDHSHKTGKVRGLLCSRCNLGIGILKDDITFLQNAINYLEAANDQP